MTSQLETLSDYPALKKLAEALWYQDSKQCGAAIMVGAGFSRCSASHVGGTKKLPLWFDFANKLARELDENNRGQTPINLKTRLIQELLTHISIGLEAKMIGKNRHKSGFCSR